MIRFDLPNIPTSNSIISAKLYLYYYTYIDNDPAGRELNLHRITSYWDESTVTWNTTPSYDSIITSSSTVPSTPGAWMEWDVTSDVQDFLNHEKLSYGWQIMDENYWGAILIFHL